MVWLLFICSDCSIETGQGTWTQVGQAASRIIHGGLGAQRPLPSPPTPLHICSGFLHRSARPSVSWVLRVSPCPAPACSAASSKDRVLQRMFSCPACPFLQSSALCRAQACPPLKGERSWKPQPVFHFKQKAGARTSVSAHSQPRGFQLGPASVRNEEWARPAFGDVRWKLQAANSGLPGLCSHSPTASTSAAWRPRVETRSLPPTTFCPDQAPGGQPDQRTTWSPAII